MTEENNDVSELPKDHPKRARGRGIYLLPNLFTTAALFAGFYAVLASMDGQFEKAALAIFLAMVLDGLDGRVARMTHTQTAFGAEYDSLSDMVAFGLAPALVMYQWALNDLGKVGWMAAFIYTAGAALRLARFNTQAGVEDKGHFQGLASPAAAGTLVTTIWFFVDQGIDGATVRWLILFETLALGLLMFSRVRYFSFKKWPKGDRVPTTWIFLAVVIFVLLAVDPPAMMMLIGIVYVVSGLIITVLGRHNWKMRRARRLASRRAKKRRSADVETSPADE